MCTNNGVRLPSLQPHEKVPRPARPRSMTCWTRRRRATGKTCRLGLSSAPSPAPWGSAWLAAGAVVVLLLSGEASALMCYKDMHGVHTSDGDDPVDTNKFEIRNCTHNGTGKIEKVCERDVT